jgi:SAM-dependent methyltransferase
VLPHICGARVLEIGFGTGELLGELAGRQSIHGPGHVTGLELSSQMQAVAARRLADQGGRTPRVQAAAGKMPFCAGSFDTVVATFPAPYILEPDTLAECARVLQGGGRLVVAGLWVRVRHASLHSTVPLFYADPPAAALALIAQRVEEAGFRVQWHDEVVDWAVIPVLVAQLP